MDIFLRHFSLYIIPIAGLVPLLVGAMWYSPALFGKVWMRVSGVTEEQVQAGGMMKIFALTYIFGVLAAYMLAFATVHQFSFIQLFFLDPSLSDPTSEFSRITAEYMDKFGQRHRTFGHGLIHGFENGLLISLAMIGIPALFERKPWKYICIHVGFWTVNFALMAGILCQFL